MAKPNFIQRLFGAQAQKAHITFSQIFGGFVPPEATAQERLKAYNAWVFACVNAIAEVFANINLRLLKLENGDMVEQQEHPLLDLLFRVNPFQSKADFLQLHQTYMELSGESFIFLERGTENPSPNDPIKEMWLLRPDFVEIVPDPTKFIKGYNYRIGGKATAFAPHEIIHFKYPNPLNQYRGMSPVQAAALAVDQHKFASEWNRNFFFNSANPSAVLQTDKELTDEQWRRVKAEWEANYRGRDNAHKMAVLEAGLKFQTTQMTQKEMDFMRLKDSTRDEILGIFRVPKTALGITDDVNRANAEATTLVFMERVIKPKMQRFVDTLNEFLVPLFGDDLVLDFDDPTPENREAKINEFVQGHNRWLSTNDIRTAEGLPPISGGDNIFQSIALLPLGKPIPPEGEADDGEDADEEVVTEMVKMIAPPAVNVKEVRHKAELKRKLLAGNTKRKRIEEMRRKIALIIEARQNGEVKEDATNDERVDLLNKVASLESQTAYLEADNVAKEVALEAVTKEKEEAERVAAEALALKADETNNGTTEA